MTRVEIENIIFNELCELDKKYEEGKLDPRYHFLHIQELYDRMTKLINNNINLSYDRAVRRHQRYLGVR